MLVKFNAKRVLGFKDVLIVPGINDLPDDLVAEMLDDEILAGKFDREELQVIGKEDVGAKKVSGKSGVALLLAASDKNAVNLAGQTIDMGILDTWLSKEKRIAVRKAIKAQLAKIKDIKYREQKDKQTLEKDPAADGGEE